MDFSLLVDIFFNAPKYLDVLFSQYYMWAYIILFAILFFETGIVITPFLPGDSILFGVGAIAAVTTKVNLPLLIILLMSAAVLGDSLNYEIGRTLRVKVNDKKKLRFIKYEYILRTQKFFEKHGGKTITIARFIPIIRTFAPFVSGVSKMKYSKFLFYNVIGGVGWVALMFGIGYFFGNIPTVKNNFSLVVIGIIVVSLMPAVAALIKSKKKKTSKTEG